MFKHILLASDGSEAAAHAARMAVDLARTHGARLSVVYVVDPYPYLGIGEANPLGFQAYMGAAQEIAARVFAEVTQQATQAGVAVSTHLVENVQAHKGIIEAAAAGAADLIMLGSHGRSGLERLVLGSVAGKVVAQSPRPVLVTR